MNLKLEQMDENNLKEIFDFEYENRSFFESLLPPRPEGYYDFESFEALMKEIMIEQQRGECHMCIVRDVLGKVVGRVNLHSIRDENGRKAELGYRIGKYEQGKGYASEAVRLILEEGINKFRLSVIEAGAASGNLASQKVLQKNGFDQVGFEKAVMKVNGEWVDGVLFEKRCH